MATTRIILGASSVGCGERIAYHANRLLSGTPASVSYCEATNEFFVDCYALARDAIKWAEILVNGNYVDPFWDTYREAKSEILRLHEELSRD